MLMDHAMHHWGLASMRFAFIIEIETAAPRRALERDFDTCVAERLVRTRDNTLK